VGMSDGGIELQDGPSPLSQDGCRQSPRVVLSRPPRAESGDPTSLPNRYAQAIDHGRAVVTRLAILDVTGCGLRRRSTGEADRKQPVSSRRTPTNFRRQPVSWGPSNGAVPGLNATEL